MRALETAMGETAMGAVGLGLVEAADETPMAWVVLITRTSMEETAKYVLERQAERGLLGPGFEVYLPLRLYENKRRETLARPFLPGYLFARVSCQKADWRRVFGSRGVRGVLGVNASCSWGLKDHVVGEIRAREDGGFIRLGLADDEAPASFLPGQKVKLDGSVDAMVLERVDARRVAILLSMFRRDSRHIVDLKRLSGSES